MKILKQLRSIKFSKRGNIFILIVAASGILMILIAFFGSTTMMAFGFAGGWETRTQMHKIRASGKWYSASTVPIGDIPWGPKVVQFDPTDPKEYSNWDSVREPDIKVSVDDPIHTAEDEYHNLLKTKDGTKVKSAPLDEYVREISRQRGDDTYFYHHHVYAYTVTVRTVGDVQEIGVWNWNVEAKAEEGIKVTFTVRSKFSVSPWQIVGDTFYDAETDQDFVVTEAFVGIMAANAEIVDKGFTERYIDEMDAATQLLTVPSGWDITGLPDEHAALNMYTVDEKLTPMNGVPTDPSTILDVPREVLIDVSGTLWNGVNSPLGYTPTVHDVFVTVTIRVDILTAAGYAPVAGTDPLPDPPDDDKMGPAPFWYPLAYALGNVWGNYWWLIVMVVVIVLIVLVLVVKSKFKYLLGPVGMLM